MPDRGAAGSPRNTARSDGDGARSSVGQSPSKRSVHQDLEAEPVAPEPQAHLDVADADGGVVDDRHWIRSLDSESKPVIP